jgi:multicomponent Na+:H+ antiporter subunit C
MGTGAYLLLQRVLSRVIIGLALMSNGVNVLIILSSRAGGEPPVIVEGSDVAAMADPLPQAMVLTAIVITFGVTALLLALALRSYLLAGDDEVEDDVEDRRIGRMQREQADGEEKEEEVATP